jgi:hypothetical protein
VNMIRAGAIRSNAVIIVILHEVAELLTQDRHKDKL